MGWEVCVLTSSKTPLFSPVLFLDLLNDLDNIGVPSSRPVRAFLCYRIGLKFDVWRKTSGQVMDSSEESELEEDEGEETSSKRTHDEDMTEERDEELEWNGFSASPEPQLDGSDNGEAPTPLSALPSQVMKPAAGIFVFTDYRIPSLTSFFSRNTLCASTSSE